ncbi:MAG: hypothetical protein QM756_43865 [Polyangiaceae bacterium]
MTAASKAPLPALLLYAKGNVSWQQCVADTLTQGFGVNMRKLPAPVLTRLPKRLQVNPYDSLSYVEDWAASMQRSPRLDVVLCNVCDLTALARWMPKIREFPLIFVMHSANGDGIGHLDYLAHVLRRRRGLLTMFVANEYNFLEEKRRFLRTSEADFVATQLPPEPAAWLYADCGRARVVKAYAALNTQAFSPPPNGSAGERTWDIAFRGNAYKKALGDDERTRAIVGVREAAERAKLRVNIEFSMVPSGAWADLLRSTWAIPGAESGTYYLERDSSAYHRAEAYVLAHPNTTLEYVRETYYTGGTWPVSGKMLSSRHLEPMGTKTCQILVEGEYSGVLAPDVHYIPLAKDLSNMQQALEKFSDVTFRTRVAESAYELAMSEHTFERRITQILNDIGV